MSRRWPRRRFTRTRWEAATPARRCWRSGRPQQVHHLARALGGACRGRAAAGPEHHRRHRSQALRGQVDNIDFEAAARYEKKLRHDVMAHVHAYGDAAPEARAIIHLGATSCYVTDNTDLILLRESLRLVRDRLVGAIDALATFAERYKGLPCLGYTHFQPAQLVTVGKRATLWCQDLLFDLKDVERRIDDLTVSGREGHDRHAGQLPGAFRRRS